MGKMLYWCRRPFDYDAGLSFDREQIIELHGLRNDEKLIRLGYVQELKGNDFQVCECAVCGAQFISMNGRDTHIKMRHSNFAASREVAPTKIFPGVERDALYDEIGHRIEVAAAQDISFPEQQEKRLEQVAPLYLDKTEATRSSGDAVYEVVTETKRRPGRPPKIRA